MKSLIGSIALSCERKGFLQEQFGRENTEGEYVGGAIENVPAYLLLRLRKADLWPIQYRIDSYSEDDIFDVIEFLYDHVSKGISSEGSIFEDDYSSFDKTAGQEEFKTRISEVLAAYGDGFELTSRGEVVPVGEEGLKELFVAQLPTEDGRIRAKVESAISRYRSRHSDLTARKDAVRDLADVCELLRPKIKKFMLKKDEDGLFLIANSYGIRHHTDLQKTDYGTEWLSWFFYLYLSTIHLCLRILKREGTE
jgi:uncharacterized protein YifE (UPF0438 family)